MALQSYNLTVGNLVDDAGGNNYAASKAVYITNLNGTLAQIFADEAGLIPIIQDGVSNVTNSSGVFSFWIEAGDYNAQVGSSKYRVSITGADYFNSRIDQTVNDIVESVAGRGAYYPVGNFADGFVYTDINQVGLFGTDYYIYNGGLSSLPHPVPAGTDPTLSSSYSRVFFTDHNTATNRGASDSHPSSAISYFNGSLKSQLDGMRLGGSSIGSLVKRNGKTVVITGDSLSYNHQGLDATARPTAESCHVGMRSWSFMLRDIIHQQDAYFKYMDELPTGYVRNSTTVAYNTASAEQINSFGGRIATLRCNVAENEAFAFDYKHSGDGNAAYLIIQGDPSGLSCNYTVSVDGANNVNSTTKLSTAIHQGRRLVFVPLTVPNDGQYHTIRLFNFAQAADTPDPSGDVQLNVVGVTSKYTNVQLTGVGGFNTADLLTQWNTRAVSYNPDAVIMIIGANDSYDGLTIAQYKANLQTMIDQVRAVKPDCDFLMISTPGSDPSNSFGVADSVTEQFVLAMAEICELNRCSFLDSYSLFKSLTPDSYRFDWVHFNRLGNSYLCEKVASACGLTYKVQDYDTDFSLVNQQVFNEIEINGSTAIGSPNNLATKTYQTAVRSGVAGVVKSATSTDGQTIVVEFFRDLEQLGNVSITQDGYDDAIVKPVITSRTSNTVSFVVFKADGVTLVSAADYANPLNLNFIISY